MGGKRARKKSRPMDLAPIAIVLGLFLVSIIALLSINNAEENIRGLAGIDYSSIDYASTKDFFYPNKEYLTVEIENKSEVEFTVNVSVKAADTHFFFIYKTGYYTDYTGAWEPFTLTPDAGNQSGDWTDNWIRTAAKKELTFRHFDYTDEPGYIVVYTCRRFSRTELENLPGMLASDLAVILDDMGNASHKYYCGVKSITTSVNHQRWRLIDFLSPESDDCTPECASSGSTECIDSDSYKMCGEYDDDECLEWSDAVSCDDGDTCEVDTCLPDGNCNDTCDDPIDYECGTQTICGAPEDCGTCGTQYADRPYCNSEGMCVQCDASHPCTTLPEGIDPECADPVCDSGTCSYTPKNNNQTCTGPDGPGTCADGACVPDGCTSSTEVCDGIDDDCDGQVDEGSDLCTSPKTCQSGSCQCPTSCTLGAERCGTTSCGGVSYGFSCDTVEECKSQSGCTVWVETIECGQGETCNPSTHVCEGSTTYQCNDGIDNDGDTLIDYGDDPGCTSAFDDDENACTETCTSDNECNSACGTGDCPDDPDCAGTCTTDGDSCTKGGVSGYCVSGDCEDPDANQASCGYSPGTWLEASRFEDGLSPQCCEDDTDENHNYKRWFEDTDLWADTPHSSSAAACCTDSKDCVLDNGQCRSNGDKHVSGDVPWFCSWNVWYECTGDAACRNIPGGAAFCRQSYGGDGVYDWYWTSHNQDQRKDQGPNEIQARDREEDGTQHNKGNYACCDTSTDCADDYGRCFNKGERYVEPDGDSVYSWICSLDSSSDGRWYECGSGTLNTVKEGKKCCKESETSYIWTSPTVGGTCPILY